MTPPTGCSAGWWRRPLSWRLTARCRSARATPYGEPGELPAGGVVVRSDAEAGAVLDAARRGRRALPRSGPPRGRPVPHPRGRHGQRAAGGAVHRRPGRGAAGRTPPPVRRPPGGPHPAVDPGLRGHERPVRSVDWNLGPRAHPNDGLLDTYDAQPAPRPAPAGPGRGCTTAPTCPIPGIKERRTAALQVELDRPLTVRLDGAGVGPARVISVRVAAGRPDRRDLIGSNPFNPGARIRRSRDDAPRTPASVRSGRPSRQQSWPLPPSPASAPAPAAQATPPNDRARGLVWDGLAPGRAENRCLGGFEIRGRANDVLGCTHGPDPAPANVDVRAPMSTETLAGMAAALPAPAPGPGTNGNGIACSGDGTSGFRVEAIYATAGGTDRYASVAPLIQTSYAPYVEWQYRMSAAETGGEVARALRDRGRRRPAAAPWSCARRSCPPRPTTTSPTP